MENITAAQIIEKTNNVYNIFKYAVQLNADRFKGHTLRYVVHMLEEFTGIDGRYINEKILRTRIRVYCETYPNVGIVISEGSAE